MHIEFTSHTIVNENNTAIKLDSGDMPVFATPAMAALMENAAMNAAAIYIRKTADPKDNSVGELNVNTTVGISLNITHTKASPIGKTIKAIAILEEIDGRKLTFKVSAYECDSACAHNTNNSNDTNQSATEHKNNDILIGCGTHERFIVNREKFLSKIG